MKTQRAMGFVVLQVNWIFLVFSAIICFFAVTEAKPEEFDFCISWHFYLYVRVVIVIILPFRVIEGRLVIVSGSPFSF